MTIAADGTPERLSRRELLAYTAAFGSSFLAAQGLAAEPAAASRPPGPPENDTT